jgi:hypothetical protein
LKSKTQENLKTALPYIAVFGALALAAYAFMLANKRATEVKEDDIPLDFDHDPRVLSSINEDRGTL